jgi:hypothetical protein
MQPRNAPDLIHMVNREFIDSGSGSLKPIGQYVAAQFTASDGYGGTLIGDPPVATTNAAPITLAAHRAAAFEPLKI